MLVFGGVATIPGFQDSHQDDRMLKALRITFGGITRGTVDGWNPGSTHQLRLVVYPIIYKVLYISGGCLGFLNHQQYE